MRFLKTLINFGLIFLSAPAMAQTTAGQSVIGYYTLAPQTGCVVGPCFVPYGSTVPVSGTFSASLSGFQPSGSFSTNNTTTTTSTTVLPTNTGSISVTNQGSNTAYVSLSNGSGTATISSQALVAGATVGFSVGSNTNLNAITSSGTTTLSIAGGSGLVTGYGGGSGGGGSSGAVFGPTAVGSAAANPPILIGGTANALSNGAVQVAKVDSSGELSVISASLPLPTGAATSALQSSVQGSVSGGTAATSSNLIGGVFNTSAPTLTNGQQAALQLTSSGSLNVNVTNNGVTDGTSITSQTYSPIAGKAESSPATRTNNTLTPPSIDLSGNLRVNCITGCSSPTVGTSFTLTAAASTNATSVKASAGTLRHISVYNNSATLAWVSFYNTAGTPTCGTSIVYQVMIPANSTSGSGSVEDISAGLNFSTGIGICVTTGIAGTGSVAASTYVVNLGFN